MITHSIIRKSQLEGALRLNARTHKKAKELLKKAKLKVEELINKNK